MPYSAVVSRTFDLAAAGAYSNVVSRTFDLAAAMLERSAADAWSFAVDEAAIDGADLSSSDAWGYVLSEAATVAVSGAAVPVTSSDAWAYVLSEAATVASLPSVPVEVQARDEWWLAVGEAWMTSHTTTASLVPGPVPRPRGRTLALMAAGHSEAP
jgi:hypothetical protein